MASTVAREQLGMMMEQQISEIDSESSSSCEDREARKRMREDPDNNLGGSPKKRRKQTTPVRFPTSLMGNNGEKNESEDEEDEGEEEEEEEEEEDEEQLEGNDLDVAGEPGERRNDGATTQVNEADEALLEGKPRTLSPQAYVQNIIGQTTTATGTMATFAKDENLNSEFRCQFCALSFIDNESLSRHLECEHAVICNAAPSNSPLSDQVRIKLEPSSQVLEDPESPVNLSGLGVKSFASNWLNSQVQAQQQQQIQLQSQNPEDWTSPSPVTSVPNHLQALTFPGALAQYLPLPGFPLTDAGQLTRPLVGPAPIRIFNPDAYCDLCNKEFCNKYFLKTHKANKHGIYVDAPSQNPADNMPPGGIPPGMFTGAFAGGSIVKSEQSQRLEVPTPLVSVPLSNSVPCDVCQKRFKNEDSLRKHKQKVHNESIDNQESHSLPATSSSVDEDRDLSRNSPSAMEALFKQEFGVEQEDSKFMPAPRHLSPQSSQQARDSGFNVDRLRRLGVINPEAFCEICCKEYCNKYFLRTHKMKRHGIYVGESEKPPSNPGNAATWHQIQTSPLNLIVTESNAGSSSESGDRPGEDFECKPCGIRFQTLGLYRAHRAKIHETDESSKQDFDTEPTDQRSDSISEDLQKLQTMILQINGLEASKTLNCGICGRECENFAALRTHMRLEHGGIADEIASQANENSLNGTSTFCTICEKEYQSPDALRQHITEEHQQSNLNNVSTTIPSQPPTISPTISVQTSNPTVTAPVTIPTPSAGLVQTPTAPQPERKITSMTPTSSYCELCRKELCNKYFMKTHMQKMHNIEIENGSQIGGVVCNICNKELCSKYFLRVHKQNTHGIVDEGSTASNKQDSFESSSNEDAALKPDQLGDLSHRYFTHFTEVCPVCSRRFRSIKWLKAHLLGDHGKVGIEKWRELENQYQNSSRGGGARSAGGGVAGRVAPQNQSIKIPNGLEMVQQQMKSNDYIGLGNQVLSSLFGSATEDQQSKSYRCSYCNFTTTVLPFLFLHERSHTSPQDNNASGDSGSILCPICTQAFAQPELLQHHLLTRHQFSGLLSQMPAPLINSPRLEAGSVEKNNEIYEKAEYEGKEEHRQSSPQVSLGSIESPIKSQKPEEPVVQVTPQGAYKCAQCGYATANLNRIKKHVRKDHKAMGDATESVIDELSKTLRDVANKHKVPASYAMPQDMNSNPDATTVMQPFLIEERDIAGKMGDEMNQEKRFAPALVYLPVRARINSSLTTSFTLSPA